MMPDLFRNATQKHHHDTPLHLEQLESRQLLTVTPTLLSINPSGDASPAQLTEVSGTTYFAANDGTHGVELWKSDGTSTGTQLVKDLRSGNLSSSPKYLTNLNGTLYFSANGDNGSLSLWKSDGTSIGTELIQETKARSITNIDGTLFFSAPAPNPGLPNLMLKQLWMSDGTEEGTVPIESIGGDSGYYPIYLTNVNGVLFYQGAYTGGLWKSDGTSAGSYMVKDPYPYVGSGDFGTHVEDLRNVDGTVFFTADDGTYGRELWKSDGTSTGTVMVKEIRPGPYSPPIYFTPPARYQERENANVNGVLFFRFNDGSYGMELWKSDGTSAGTVMIKDINPSGDSVGPFMANINGTLFFTANDGSTGVELWMSDGTSSGTRLVKDVHTGGSDAEISWIRNVNGTVFFNANDGTHGSELWMTDGTSSGTGLVKDLNPTGDASPHQLTNINGTLFFAANDGSNGMELWRLSHFQEVPLIITSTDAGEAGTVRIHDSQGNELSNFYPYTSSFTGGVRIATGDINGDGSMDIVTAAGPSGGPHIQVFDSRTGELIDGALNNFYAYHPSITVGVYVAVGDMNNDGFDDIITSPDAGGGPHVKVFSGQDGSVITEFYAYTPSFTGGVRIASGDVNGDDNAEIITAPGAGGGPHILVFSGTTGSALSVPATNFYAYDPSFLGGVYIASGDIDNDGLDDIITAPGSGLEPRVKVFSSDDASLLQNFYAYDPSFTGSVRVGSADINRDGYDDILTVPGAPGGPHTRAFSGTNLADLANFYSGSPTNYSGLFVAGGVNLETIDLASAMSAPLSHSLAAKEAFFADDSAEVASEESSIEYLLKEKKSWWEEADEFYQQAEEIDELFSGLGI
ncbi:Hypothetical protein PBC10988_24230 [Planctomycetales bacterium 10988]|nr:Hypothetical protein PBC10988_24230 [Planctomycetales bacterium 10988]